jgi:hypothetical protein
MAYESVFNTLQIGELVDCSISRKDSYTPLTDIEFGKLVSFTDEENQVEQRSSGALPVGVTVYDRNRVEGKYKFGTIMAVLTFGRIVVQAYDDVQQGQLAYAGLNGQVRTAPHAVDDNFPIGVFLSSAESGQKTILEVRL